MLFVAGLGSTGSSAVVDLLKEVESFVCMDDEFRLLSDPDGLLALRNTYLNLWSHYQCDTSIRRYESLVHALSHRWASPYANLNHSNYFGDDFEQICLSLVQELTHCSYNGLWYGIDNHLMRKLNTFDRLYRSRLTTRKMCVPKVMTRSEIDLKLSELLYRLAERMNPQSPSRFVFNENLSCMFTDQVLEIVPDARIILVIRDPKDVYADSLRVKWPTIPEDFEKYVAWQKSIYLGWTQKHDKIIKRKEISDRFLLVRFEELIQNYESEKRRIFNFLDISATDHIRNLKFLDPERSAPNIGQWKSVVSSENAQYLDRELSFFLERYYQGADC